MRSIRPQIPFQVEGRSSTSTLHLGQCDQSPLGLQARFHVTLGRAQIGMSGDALHVPQARTRLGAASGQVCQQGSAPAVAAGPDQAGILVNSLEPVGDAVGAMTTKI